MIRRFIQGFIRYHRGLRKMPSGWKPWLITLLVANMIVPLFWIDRSMAQLVFGVALLNYLTFIILTGLSGFSRLLGLGHIYWIPLVGFLCTQLENFPSGDDLRILDSSCHCSRFDLVDSGFHERDSLRSRRPGRNGAEPVAGRNEFGQSGAVSHDRTRDY